MRTAVISDIHGNYHALAKVIEDAEKNSVGRYIFAGDYIFDLPFSNEVVSLLMEVKNARIIKGNKEVYLGRLAREDQKNWTYSQMGCVYQTFRELRPVAFEFLNGLDEECYIQLNPSVTVYAAHVPAFLKLAPKPLCSSSSFRKRMLAEPFTHEQYLAEFGELINTGECKSVIDNINADVIIFGHNHLQAHAYCGKKLIVNPGSCGQPLDFNPAAAYTILEETADGLNVIEKRVEYDVESVIERAKQSLMYQKGKIWSELVFLALMGGRDYFGLFFEIAAQIASDKNEKGAFFSNATWEEAGERFFSGTARLI